MCGAFQRFHQLLHVIVAEPGRQPQGPRMYDEPFSLLLSGLHQS